MANRNTQVNHAIGRFFLFVSGKAVIVTRLVVFIAIIGRRSTEATNLSLNPLCDSADATRNACVMDIGTALQGGEW